MIKHKIFFLFIFFQNILASEHLCVVLMVRNEETVINKTVEPYVKEGIKNFLIFEAGKSTDKTIETVEEYFKKNNVKNYKIFREDFIDFAASRNRALDLAEENFPEVTFFLMPDAEWIMHNVKGLLGFCQENLNDTHQCYLIKLGMGIEFVVSRLIRAKTKSRFVGKVHEVVVAEKYKTVPKNIWFELNASRAGIEKSRKRWTRDLEILKKVCEENPQDSRSLFYLSQTYECLGLLKEAFDGYINRSKMAGWPEENFETFLRLGKIAEYLSDTDKSFTWEMAMDFYLQAHKILPLRAEPLVKIAHHYWPEIGGPKNVTLAYLFAKRAYELSYPYEATLFIDTYCYNFLRYEILSKSAWQAGDYQLGEIATKKAIEFKPMAYLYRNLASYMEINEYNKKNNNI